MSDLPTEKVNDVEFRGSLEKRIPSRMHRVEFNWVHLNFAEMSEKFLEVRAKWNRDPMDSCFWCAHKFVNGEMMGLAQPKKGGNKMICQDCAKQALGRV